MLLYKFPFGPLETNALLIGCGETKRAVIIDPSYQSTETLLRYISTWGLEVEKILLTHSHWDHFADASLLQKKLGVPLFVHPLDAENVQRPGVDRIPLFFPIEPATVDHLVHEREIIQVGKLAFEVIHTPGHSPGGVCYHEKEKRLLISGDTLFRGTMGSLSLPTAAADAMWLSLKKLSLLPKETRVVPGHGEDTTIGDEAWLMRAKQIFDGWC